MNDIGALIIGFLTGILAKLVAGGHGFRTCLVTAGLGIAGRGRKSARSVHRLVSARRDRRLHRRGGRCSDRTRRTPCAYRIAPRPLALKAGHKARRVGRTICRKVVRTREMG